MKLTLILLTCLALSGCSKQPKQVQRIYQTNYVKSQIVFYTGSPPPKLYQVVSNGDAYALLKPDGTLTDQDETKDKLIERMEYLNCSTIPGYWTNKWTICEPPTNH